MKLQRMTHMWVHMHYCFREMVMITRGEAAEPLFQEMSQELSDRQGEQDLVAVGVPEYTIIHEVATTNTANAADASANPSEVCFNIQIINDSISERDEEFVVSFQLPLDSGAQVGPLNSTCVSIIDDDSE